jgi:hypothetical protein
VQAEVRREHLSLPLLHAVQRIGALGSSWTVEVSQDLAGFGSSRQLRDRSGTRIIGHAQVGVHHRHLSQPLVRAVQRFGVLGGHWMVKATRDFEEAPTGAIPRLLQQEHGFQGRVQVKADEHEQDPLAELDAELQLRQEEGVAQHAHVDAGARCS